MSVTVKQGGNPPTGDGDINLYVNAEGSSKPWFDRSRRVVFVNGMANKPEDHQRSALALSLIQACPVVGVYNKKASVWEDLGQCLRDKLTLYAVQSGDFEAWSRVVDAAFADKKRKVPGLSKVGFVADLIKDNAATLSLYHYLTGLGSGERAKTKIFCHSQGNLITSNALTAVALALGLRAISGMEVNSFGSPCRYWPTGLRRTNNAFTFDPVSWLDYNVGFESAKVGLTPGLFAHGFDIYMKHDAEFVVNRFRWGAVRMTASMDEDGLATFLVRQGSNAGRIKSIIQWLDKHHNSDADDVVVIYARKMRERHGATLSALARANKSLIELMIKCMDEGPTFSDEDREIAHLRSLI